MTKKRPLITCLVVTFLIILLLKFYGYYHKEDKGFIGYCGRLLNQTNDFEYSIDGIDHQDIDIIWTTEGNSDTLVKNGVLLKNFGYEYGPNTFTVVYKDQQQLESGFFSQNNNDHFDVKLDITKEANYIRVTYNFNGKISSVSNRKTEN